MDDIIVIDNDKVYMKKLVTLLNTKFSLKDLDDLYFFLSIDIKWCGDTPHLCQQKYIKQLLIKAGLESSKPLKKSMAYDIKLSKYEGLLLVDPTPFWSIFGTL